MLAMAPATVATTVTTAIAASATAPSDGLESQLSPFVSCSHTSRRKSDPTGSDSY